VRSVGREFRNEVSGWGVEFDEEEIFTPELLASRKAEFLISIELQGRKCGKLSQ
jgi:hypothetical protein